MDAYELFGLSAGALGGALVLALLFGRWRRGWIVAALLAAIALGGAVYLGTLSAQAQLPSFPWRGLALIAAWWLLGRAARRAGGLGLPIRAAGPVALLSGALIGDLAAAALLAPQVDAPAQRARIALTASAGSALTGLGGPATLLAAGPVFDAGLAMPALGIALALLAWPRGAQLQAGGSGALTAAMVAAAALSWWRPEIGVVAALLAAATLGRRGEGASPSPGRDPWLHLAALGLLIWVAELSGALWQAEWGVTRALARLDAVGAALASLLAAGLAAIGGEAGAALLAERLVAAPLYPRFEDLGLYMAGGLVAGGGLGALAAAGALRAGWRLWLLHLAVAAVWAAAVF